VWRRESGDQYVSGQAVSLWEGAAGEVDADGLEAKIGSILNVSTAR
jgi:hypothetical protein